MRNVKIISLPSNVPSRSSKKQIQIKNTDRLKYYNKNQIQLLRRTVKNKAILDQTKGKIGGIREWMVIDLLTTTGVRVSEAANVRCGDLKLGYAEREIYIRDGKAQNPEPSKFLKA